MAVLKINKNIISFFLGLFTFLAELVILRQTSVFLGSGIKATGVIIFLFILGMGIGNLLSIKNYRGNYFIILACSIGLMVFSLSSEIIFYIPIHKIYFVYLFSFFVVLPGLLSGFFYADLIKRLKNDRIVLFILFNVFGSLLGCVISLFLYKFLSVKSIFILLSFTLVMFLFKKRIIFFLCLLLNILLLFITLTSPPQVNPVVYHEILKETKKITFPLVFPELKFGKIKFRKPSLFGEVIVDETNHLSVHNEVMCWQDSIDEREMSKIIHKLNPDAKEVLVVGLGCGMTLDEFLIQNKNEEVKVKVIEINPVVVEAEKLFFGKENPVNDQRVKLIIDNGFKYLINTDQKFDTIIIDVSNPISLESSEIYTKEFVQLLFNHLSDKGKIVWWNFMTNSEFDRVVYSTIRSVFPYVVLKKLNYSILFFFSKTPFFITLTNEEAKIMNEYESLPFIVNSIGSPIIK